ncbi:MAG: hypothetical protein Tsb0019_10550 [Roseibium sp.]
MSIPDVRFRKEDFGYTLAFASGTVGFYSEQAGRMLLNGCTEQDLEACLLDEIPLERPFKLAGPLVAWIELTRACNLPCKHCYISAGRARQNELSYAELTSLLDQLKAQGVFCVVFLGGEPMMHPQFCEIVQYAHELGFVISIGTNGTYITEEIIERLPRQECYVSVSLDGIAYQKEIRKKSTFEDIWQRLLLLKKHDIPTGIMTVMTDENIGELHEILDLAIENGFYFGKTPFTPIGRGRHFRHLLPTPDKAASAVALEKKDDAHERRMMSETGLTFTKFFQQCYKLSAAIRQEFCGISLVYIQSDGEVFPCTTCASAGKYAAGNLREQTFAEIWENGFGAIRAIGFDDFKSCGSCDLSASPYFCTSRCPVTSEVYTGDPLACGSTPFLKESLRLAMKDEVTGLPRREPALADEL